MKTTSVETSPFEGYFKMKTVLILGAAGYIGESIASALRRSGHRVIGVTRSAGGEEKLLQSDVEVLRGDATDSAVWRHVAAQSDVVIDAVGYVAKQSEAVLQSVPAEPLFVFVSGCMSYGTAMDGAEAPLLNEQSQRKPSPSNANGAPRVAFEDSVLARGGVVVRPGWVYGRGGGHYNKFFFDGVDAANNTATITGRGNVRYSWVHVDDLAEAFALLVAKAKHDVAGKDFNFNAPDFPSREEIVLAAARTVIDPHKLQIVRKELPADHFLEVNIMIDPVRAREILGWKPRHKGFLAEMPLYYKGWLSANKKH